MVSKKAPARGSRGNLDENLVGSTKELKIRVTSDQEDCFYIETELGTVNARLFLGSRRDR